MFTFFMRSITMDILVTGGAGFIGSHVLEKLQKVSEPSVEEIKVVVLDDLSNGSREHVPSGMELVVGDVRDKNVIEDVFSRPHFSAIIHTVCGGGNQTRDFVYVGDIASVIVQTLPLTGYHTINVSTGTETSINDLFHSFERAIGTQGGSAIRPAPETFSAPL